MRGSHQEIFQCLKREILAGQFDGVAFPSAGEIARRFKVSRPTVCRAMLDLRHEGLVTTRPGAAPRLTPYAEHATGTLAILHPGLRYGGVLDEIFRDMVRLGEAAGWDIVVRGLRERIPERRAHEICRHVRSFLSERVSGLFLQPFDCLAREHEQSLRQELSRTLANCSMPIVLLDYDLVRRPQRTGYDLVAMDNLAAGFKLGRRLVAEGARSLAFLLRPGSAPSVEERMRGVAIAALEAGLTWAHQSNVLACAADDDDRIRRFVVRRRPDAMVCGNDITALELQAALERCGFGGSVRLAGFDGEAAAVRAGIVSVRQPVAEIAELAIETMVARLKTPSLPVRTVLVGDSGICPQP